MIENQLNKNYWEQVPADKIIGRNAFPGDELFGLLNNGDSILDLGCGTGELSEYLSEKDYLVTGIDINEEAININQSKKSRVDYILCDITNPLPFVDHTCNAITISFVLVNIVPLSMREELIKELSRILKPNGIIWINEGLISDEYSKRYELCKPFLHDDHDFFVFKENTQSSGIQTTEELEKAIADEKIQRVAHHFTVKELTQLFSSFKLIYKNQSVTFSPNTKSAIKMITAAFKLKP
ncbi:MAG: class I SAM-dependent methyltransferase [bacterium]